MKLNLVFLFSLILGLFMVSCSAENGEIGIQDKANNTELNVLSGHSSTTAGGEEIRLQEPEDE